jgi:CheY-like chemotaxis protein
LQSALHALRLEPADWFLAETLSPPPLPAEAAAPPPLHAAPETRPPSPPSEPPPRAEPPARSATGSARPLRVLIAAPNPANRKIMGYVLQRAGHTVHPVETVDAGRPLLERGEIDLLLLDLTAAPGNDEAARHCRRMWPGLRLVGLVGDTSIEAERRGREAGLDAVLTKPIEPGRLLAAIGALGRAEAPASPSDPVVTRLASHPRFAGDGGPLAGRVADPPWLAPPGA